MAVQLLDLLCMKTHGVMAVLELSCLTLDLCLQLQHCDICLCSCFSLRISLSHCLSTTLTGHHEQVCFSLMDTLFQLFVVTYCLCLQRN